MKTASLLAFPIACFALAAAEAASVGMTTLTVPDGDHPALQVTVWYPSDAPTVAVTTGLLAHEVAPDGPILGTGLPLVVISHGTGSDPARHGDTARALAEAGFVVAAPTHTGDNALDQSRAIDVGGRSRHLVNVIEHMASTWMPGTVDPDRIGAFGFSAGGFTVLVAAGGQPDASHVGPHCEANPGVFECRLLAAQAPGGNFADIPAPVFVRDSRIRAIAVAAPALGYTFAPDGLSEVTVPVQIWRAEDDVVLPYPHYAEAVRAALPLEPQYHLVEGAGHFDFLAPCSDALAAAAPPICVSAPGFSRADFKGRFNEDVVRFFEMSLR